MTFEELFNNPDYRALVEKRRALRSLLEKASELKNLYEELERRYSKELDESARAIERSERAFTLPASAAGEIIAEMESSLAQIAGSVSALKRELKLNELRRENGEYGEKAFIEKRDELQAAIRNEISNEEWVKDLLVMVRNQAKAPVAGKSAEPFEEQKKPVRTAKIPLGATPEMEIGRDEIGFGSAVGAQEEKPVAPKPESKKPEPAKPSAPPKAAPAKPSHDQTSVISEDMIGSAPQRMLEAALQVKKGSDWERFPLGRKDVNIGNIRNPENEIGLYDTQTSRRHAKVIFDSITESWFIVDLGSTNGSSINGKPLTPNDPVLLKNNDSLMVGDTNILVYIP